MEAADLIEARSGCESLFGGNSYPGVGLRNAVGENKIRVIPFGDHIPAGVGAQVNRAVGVIYIASNRYFFTKRLSDGTSVLSTVDFRGLTSRQMQLAILIHEYLHLSGIVGDDDKRQVITLPTGDTVVGSTGVTMAVKHYCFGVD